MTRVAMATCALIVLLDTSRTNAEVPHSDNYNDPTEIRLSFQRTFVKLSFRWSKDRPPNFPSHLALEFEVHGIPKCFTQPISTRQLAKNATERTLEERTAPLSGAYSGRLAARRPANWTRCNARCARVGMGTSTRASNVMELVLVQIPARRKDSMVGL